MAMAGMAQPYQGPVYNAGYGASGYAGSPQGGGCSGAAYSSSPNYPTGYQGQQGMPQHDFGIGMGMPQNCFQGMNIQTSMGTGYNPVYQSSPTASQGSPYQQSASGYNPSAGYGGYGEGYGCSGATPTSGCGSPYGQYSDSQALSNYGMAPQAGYVANPQGYASVPQNGYAGAPEHGGYNASAPGYSGQTMSSYAGAGFPGGQTGFMGPQDGSMTQRGQGQYDGAGSYPGGQMGSAETMPPGYANNVPPGYGMQQGTLQDPGMMQDMNQGMQKGELSKKKVKAKKGGKRFCC